MQQEEDVYKFIERVGARVTERCQLGDNPALSSIHADKARQYRKLWEASEVPFLHGAFIYVMSYTYPYCVDPNLERTSISDWVIYLYETRNELRTALQEEDAGKAFFTVYWLNGKREVLEAPLGTSFSDAFRLAGHSLDSIVHIDWHAPGKDTTYFYAPCLTGWPGQGFLPWVRRKALDGFVLVDNGNGIRSVASQRAYANGHTIFLSPEKDCVRAVCRDIKGSDVFHGTWWPTLTLLRKFETSQS